MSDDFLNTDFDDGFLDEEPEKEDESKKPDTYVKKEKPKDEDKQSALSADEEIEALIQSSKVAQEKKTLKKERIKYAGYGAGALVLVCLIYLLFVPYTGTMRFGVCKTFLELTLPYPETLRISSVVTTLPNNSIRLWYVHTDAFGEYTMEPIQCFFEGQKSEDKLTLEKVTIRRREIDQKRVQDFNKTIPAIVANPPDLTLPAPIPDSLQDLQLETWRFRKRIL